MYKTIWSIVDTTEHCTTILTFYHFGKNPRFPAWYFEEDHTYEIEMLWNFKLLRSFDIIFKCLTHFYIVK